MPFRRKTPDQAAQIQQNLVSEVRSLRGDLREAQTERKKNFDDAVPRGVQIAAAWSWRVLLIVAMIALLGWLASTLTVVTIPMAIGIMLTAGAMPVSRWMMKRGMPRTGAAVLTLVGSVIVFLAILALIVFQAIGQSDELSTKTMEGVRQLTDWLANGPLQVHQEQLDRWLDQATQWAKSQQSRLISVLGSAGSAVGNFFAGALLAVIGMFYMLYDGPRIWGWVLNLVPKASREAVDAGGQAGWNSLMAYVRATIIVAAVDAIGPVIAAIIMGVPMVPALGTLMFISAFIPIVGIVVSGFIVTLVTLVTVGWVQALIMLGVIIMVNQLEGNVLQPLLMGKAVALHPLAVMLGITIGVSVGGIVGALLVVPMMAFGRAFIEAVHARVNKPGVPTEEIAHPEKA